MLMAPPRRTIGRYEVLQEIGRGGMAVVYLARQGALDRDIALKELASFHALDPSFAERFAREARLGGSLAHPNIVTVLEAFEHDGVPYIAMEYLERGSLRPLVGRLSLSEIAGLLEGLLAGLDYAAERGVVHRDLKPENLLVSSEGRVKIADFGVAKAYNQAWTAQFRTATGMTLGTPTYMSPEQAMGGEVGTRSDLYAVGVMAYELLAGAPPFHHLEEPMAVLLHHVSEPVPPLEEVAPDVDPRLAAWVMRLLAKDPADRPQTPQAAWEDLEDIVLALLGPRWRRDARIRVLGGAQDSRPLTPAPFVESAAPVLATTVVPPAPPAAPPPAEPRRRRRGPLFAGAAVLVVLAAVAAGFALKGGSGTDSGAAAAVKGLPACFGKLASGAVEVPQGLDVPVGDRTKAIGKTYTFLLEAPNQPVGAVKVTVRGGRTPYYQLVSVHDTQCRTVKPQVYGTGSDPNFLNYDHIRSQLAGHAYDLRLSAEKNQLAAMMAVPKATKMTLSASRTANKLTVEGSVPSDAYGDVQLTYKATRPDGSAFEREGTTTIDDGQFSASTPLTKQWRGLTDGTVTAVFEGDGNWLTASARADVPPA